MLVSSANAENMQYSSGSLAQLAKSLASLKTDSLYGVSNDGWIYYYQNPENIEDILYSTNMRKMRYDGSDNQSTEIYEVFRTVPQGNRWGYDLYQMDDYPLLQKISNNSTLITIIKDWAFYRSWDTGKMLRGKLDGSGHNVILEASFEIEGMTIYKEHLYYTLPNKNGGSSLYRIGLDGKGKKLLYGEYYLPIHLKRNNQIVSQLHYYDFLSGSIDPICIVNDVIYFISDKGTVRMNTDGRHFKVLSKNKYGSTYLDGDSIYYSEYWKVPNEEATYSSSGPIYRVKLKGGEPNKLTNGYNSLIYVNEGWLYYIDDDNSLKRFRASNPSKKEIVLQSKAGSWFLIDHIYGEWLVYEEYNRSLLNKGRVKLDGTMKAVRDKT